MCKLNIKEKQLKIKKLIQLSCVITPKLTNSAIAVEINKINKNIKG